MQWDAPNIIFIRKLAGKLNRPGRHAVHQNFGSQGARQALRQHDAACLRHAVVRVRRPRAERHQIDNPPASPAFHDRRSLLRAQELRLQVRVHHVVPLLFGQVFKLHGLKDARIVHQNV